MISLSIGTGVQYLLFMYVIGWWYSTNCGLKKAFVCRKPMDSTDIITPAPTVVVDSYCPSGYFEASEYKFSS